MSAKKSYRLTRSPKTPELIYIWEITTGVEEDGTPLTHLELLGFVNGIEERSGGGFPNIGPVSLTTVKAVENAQ